MGVVFNANEVFSMAEKIERNGAKFYRKAADNNPDSKDLLLDLASKEDEHLATFSEMHESIAGKPSESNVFDPDGEAQMYLDKIADGHVFDTQKDPSDLLQGSESLSDILRLAIGLEKDSIVFYVGLRELVPASLGRDKVDVIIKEEMTHIVTLSSALSAVS